MSFPVTRLRRLRQSEQMRKLFAQVHLRPECMVMPCFVCEGTKVRKPVGSMPGVFRLSVDNLVREAAEARRLGILSGVLFGVPDRKDAAGSGAYSEKGIVQRAVRAVKKECPEFIVMTDVCLCDYTSHGHCGLVKEISGRKVILNDETLELLSRTAVSHAGAGADIVAPSDMMDGRVKAIREALDGNGFENVPVMSYAAKFASGFYGPFREAAGSSPAFGDRKSYQMDFRNSDEALREVALDLEEGADIVMVKPALSYLDVIYRVKNELRCPVAAYNTSGEFSMVKAAAGKGWLPEKELAMEILTGIVRAGADVIITYWAKDAAKWLKQT